MLAALLGYSWLCHLLSSSGGGLGRSCSGLGGGLAYLAAGRWIIAGDGAVGLGGTGVRDVVGSGDNWLGRLLGSALTTVFDVGLAGDMALVGEHIVLMVFVAGLRGGKIHQIVLVLPGDTGRLIDVAHVLLWGKAT